MTIISRLARAMMAAVALAALLVCMAGCSATEVQKELSGLSTKVANVGKDEASQVKDLKIVKSGYTIYHKYSKEYGFATFGVCVKNPNKNYSAKDVTVVANYVGKDGSIIKTIECPVSIVGPGQSAWVGGNGGNLLDLDHLEFTVTNQVGAWEERTKKEPTYVEVSDESLSEWKGQKNISYNLKKKRKYQGLSSGGNFTVDAVEYAVFKNSKGKIIGGASNGMGVSFQGKKKIESQISIPKEISKKVDSWKIYAYPRLAKDGLF